jgi:hypothetical protein
MKTRYIYWALTAIVACAACEKEAQQEPEQQPVRTVLQVGIADTKTYLGDADAQHHRKVYWSNGDQIAVNGTASDALDGLADNTASALFNFIGDLSTPYNVLYPASIYTDATHVTLPAVQTYKEGGIADNMLPLAGYSTDGSNLSLTHLCAIVKVSVKRSSAVDADTDDIVAVRFKGKNNEKVSGEFEIAYDPAALTATTGTGDDLEVRVVKSMATSTSEAIVYYLVVPARTYSNGFDVIVQDVKGDIMTKSKASSITLDPGHLYAMAEFDFVRSGTEAGLEISSADELIAFANDYNAKKFGDDLVATITADITFDATTSVAFNATGGIGTPYGGDNYFKGIFSGNNKTISSLTSTVPLFGGIDSGSLVKDLTIDETCSFTFTRPTTEARYYGALAGYHKGTVTGVSVAADVALAAVSGVEGETGFGGLVGRMADEGTIDASTYSGNLLVPSGFATTANDKYIRVGGLAGISLSSTTKINNSHMEGTIDYAAVLTAPTSNSTTPYVTLGGIIGQNKGAVTGCDTACLDDAGDGAIKYDASDGNTYYATIVNHSTQTHCLAEGGIVGYNYGGGTIFFLHQ